MTIDYRELAEEWLEVTGAEMAMHKLAQLESSGATLTMKRAKGLAGREILVSWIGCWLAENYADSANFTTTRAVLDEAYEISRIRRISR